MQGENAWLFVDEDNVASAVKAFLEFEKKLVDRIPKDQRSKRPPPTGVSGGAMITAGEGALCHLPAVHEAITLNVLASCP